MENPGKAAPGQLVLDDATGGNYYEKLQQVRVIWPIFSRRR
jgi:hypothetical protein